MSKTVVFIAGAVAGIIVAAAVAVIIAGHRQDSETRAAILDTHARVKRICDAMEADRRDIDRRDDDALKTVKLIQDMDRK